MARGWSWQTRVKHMERRRTRRLIYGEIDRHSGANRKTEAPPPRETRPSSVFVRIGTWLLILAAIAAAVALLVLLLSWGSAGLTLLLAVLIVAVLLVSGRK